MLYDIVIVQKAAFKKYEKKELGKMIENLFLLGLAGAAIALLFAAVQAKKVLAFSEGTPKMQKFKKPQSQ